MFFKKGFTLMEIMISLFIISSILTMSFYFFGKFYKKEVLEKDISSLISLIRDARLLSITSKNASSFGIHLESSKAVLFEGSVYVAGSAGQKVTQFSNEVYLSNYSLSLGLPDIVFTRLVGSTLNYGVVTISLKDNSASTSITILETGVIQ